MRETDTVVITVSAPYDLIGGMPPRNLGRRRDYTAVYLGAEIKNTCRATIMGVIRAKAYREGRVARFEWKHEEG